MTTQSMASPQDDNRALDALKWESDGYSAAETPSDHVQTEGGVGEPSASDQGLAHDYAMEKAFKDRGVVFAPLRRAKILLCGQGRVGKTSLRRALTGQPFDAAEPSTAIAQVTCALQRVEMDGDWTVHVGDRPSWEGEAELSYIEGLYGDEYAEAWYARLKCSRSLEHEGIDDDASDDPSDVSVDDAAAAIVDTSPLTPVPSAAATHIVDTSALAPVPPALDVDVVTAAAEHDTHDRIAEHLANLEKCGDDVPIKVSMWDFGGQRLFQALQQLFLSERAIYVVAFDLTHFAEPGSPQFDEAAAELRFWCDTVALCARGQRSGDLGRIVVVGTRRDRMKSHVEMLAARQRAADVVAQTSLRSAVSADRIICVDNTRHNGSESIARLRGVLDRHIIESRDVKESVRGASSPPFIPASPRPFLATKLRPSRSVLHSANSGTLLHCVRVCQPPHVSVLPGC
jgi:GTPase SAR1 family protein